MNSYVHIDNKGKDILILGKEPTQKLDGRTFTILAILLFQTLKALIIAVLLVSLGKIKL